MSLLESGRPLPSRGAFGKQLTRSCSCSVVTRGRRLGVVGDMSGQVPTDFHLPMMRRLAAEARQSCGCVGGVDEALEACRTSTKGWVSYLLMR